MDCVSPYNLWVGHAGDGRDAVAICNAGIRAVVQLAAEEPSPTLPRDMLFFHIPLHDGSENSADNLRMAVHVVGQLLENRVSTLVCCNAGASRSPAVVACAMAAVESLPPEICLDRVSHCHGTDVSPTLWRDLLAAISSHAMG